MPRRRPHKQHPDAQLFARAFGRALRYARQQSGMSASSLARGVGVYQQAVSKWETGEGLPSSTSLLLIAEETGYPLSKLFAAAERAMEKMRKQTCVK